MNRWVIKTFAVVLVVASIATFLLFDLEQFLNPNLFKNQIGGLQDYYHQHPSTAIAVYAVAYISTTALSLPGAAVMTLLGHHRILLQYHRCHASVSGSPFLS